MTRTADAVIIGGGCMGTSVAFHLAGRGMTGVVLVERETALGAGSTGRNAAGVRHQFSTEANIRLSIESIRALEHFRDEVGQEIDFHQDGYLFLLSSPESVKTFERNVIGGTSSSRRDSRVRSRRTESWSSTSRRRSISIVRAPACSSA